MNPSKAEPIERKWTTRPQTAIADRIVSAAATGVDGRLAVIDSPDIRTPHVRYVPDHTHLHSASGGQQVKQPKRVLVVANQTAGSTNLLLLLQELTDTSDLRVTVVVPATEPEDQPVDDHGQPMSLDLGKKMASQRLHKTIEEINRLGITVDGFVGPVDPMRAAHEAMQKAIYFDSIVVSTPSPGVSRWLHMDLAHRLGRKYKLPVRRSTEIGSRSLP